MSKKLVILLLTLYPICELTRYIIAYQKYYGWDSAFQFEIGIMWILYIIGMWLVFK